MLVPSTVLHKETRDVINLAECPSTEVGPSAEWRAGHDRLDASLASSLQRRSKRSLAFSTNPGSARRAAAASCGDVQHGLSSADQSESTQTPVDRVTTNVAAATIWGRQLTSLSISCRNCSGPRSHLETASCSCRTATPESEPAFRSIRYPGTGPGSGSNSGLNGPNSSKVAATVRLYQKGVAIKAHRRRSKRLAQLPKVLSASRA